MTGIDGGILLRDIRGEQHTTIDKNCEEDGGLTDAITRTVRRVLPFCQKKPSELEEGGKKKGETRRGKNAGQAGQQIAAGASSRTCRVGRGAPGTLGTRSKQGPGCKIGSDLQKGTTYGQGGCIS